MKKEFESIEWDGNKNAVVITTQTHVSIDDTKNLEDVKEKLKGRLREIVGLVKNLKVEAESIKSMLSKLEGKADTIPVSAKHSEKL